MQRKENLNSPPESWSFPEPADLPDQQGLADPFARLDGQRVNSVDQWFQHRRYLKAMLAFYQYGHMPPEPANVPVAWEEPRPVLDGQGICRDFEFYLARNRQKVTLRANVITPPGEGPFPIIIKNDRVRLAIDPNDEQLTQMSAAARQAIAFDEDILPEALARGYAMCKFIREDLAPDAPDNRSQGVLGLYPEYDWGTIAAWAWGYQLVIDALTPLTVIDSGKIIATGHSRGGKAALCAAIYDERIALAAPNASGTGGTGSLRYFEDGRQPHQTLGSHIGQRDYWWAPRFLQFAEHEAALPFDAHTAKALVAPRALVNPCGLADFHANPFGTELTHRAAQLVYDWLECGRHIGLHWREGGHAQGSQDWRALLDFADGYFFGKPTVRPFTRLAYPDAPLPVKWRPPD